MSCLAFTRILPLSLYVLGASFAQSATYHVSSRGGSDEADGLSPAHALATIQEAAQRVVPGDTIVVAEGVYYGPIELTIAGTAEKPITIKAASRVKNAVIITNAERSIREGKCKWIPVDESLGLYQTTLNRPTCRALYSGTDLQPYKSLEALKTFTTADGNKGPVHGYYHDEASRQVYVRLHAEGKYGPPHPAQQVMCFGPGTGKGYAGNQYNSPPFFNLGLMKRGPLHVIIDGFTFETPGYAGVFTAGDHVTVRHSWFLGCRAGVSGRLESTEEKETSNDITIEYCDYTQHPAFEDVLEVMRAHGPAEGAPKFPLFWWSRKGNGAGSEKTYETGICNGVGSRWTVRYSRIHDAFEGLSCWAIRRSKGMEIYANRFERLVDNALESEDHAFDMRIHDNLILNAIEPFSWQPLGGEPWPGSIYIFNNLVRSDDWLNKLILNVSGWSPGWFKAGASRENWEAKWNGHMKEIQRDTVSAPGNGVVVFNNTVIFPNGYFLTRVQPPARRFENFWFYNNVSLAQGFSRQTDSNGENMQFSHNVWAYLPAGSDRGQTFAGEGGAVLVETEASLKKAIDTGTYKRGWPVGAGKGTGVPQGESAFPGASSIKNVGVFLRDGEWNEPVVGPQP